MSKESKALPRVFYVKAEGHQYEMPTYARKQPDDYIDLTNPSEERWIATIIQQVDPSTNPVSMTSKWLTLVEYSALEQERAKSARLLEVIKQVKVHLRAPVHFDALVQMSQICGDAIEEYNQSEGGDER